MLYKKILEEVNEFIPNKCVLCGSKTGWTVYESDFSLPDHKIWCDKCGLIYRTSVPTYEANDKFYNKFYIDHYFQKTSLQDFYDHSRTNKQRVESISFFKEYISKSISPIEVGCASGGLLSLMTEINPKSFGVDISKESVDFAISKGLNAKHIDIKDLQSEKFDLVFLSQVFEHLIDPISFLNEISRISKNNSHFLLAVPDSLNALEGPHFPHIFNFGRRQIIQLVENNSDWRFVTDNSKAVNGDILIVFIKDKLKSKKYTDFQTSIDDYNKHMERMKITFLYYFRKAYDNADSKSERVSAKIEYKKNIYEGRSFTTWLLWSKLYVFFTGRIFKNR